MGEAAAGGVARTQGHRRLAPAWPEALVGLLVPCGGTVASGLGVSSPRRPSEEVMGTLGH